MKIFITGGCGFIGIHAVEKLLADGHEVTAYDNLSTGRMLDVLPFIDTKGFQFIHGDIRNQEFLTKSMAGHDLVLHLGASGNIPIGMADPFLDLSINTIGTHTVLEAMRTNGITKILFSSTAAVYGDGAANGVALSEKHGPLFPISLYAASKLACEGMISAYCHLYDMEAWIFRFANVIGAKMGHGLLYDSIEKLLKNKNEIEVWGDGLGRKPFVHVSDILHGIEVAYRAERFTTCDIYNLGTPTQTKIETAVKIVIEEMGLSGVQLKYTGSSRGFRGDVPVVLFDVSKMESYGFRTSRTSDEAVRLATKQLLANPFYYGSS